MTQNLAFIYESEGTYYYQFGEITRRTRNLLTAVETMQNFIENTYGKHITLGLCLERHLPHVAACFNTISPFVTVSVFYSTGSMIFGEIVENAVSQFSKNTESAKPMEQCTHLPELTIATDGSRPARKSKKGAWAWVTSEGKYRTSPCSGTINTIEFAAVRDAYLYHKKKIGKKYSRLTILTDNKAAVVFFKDFFGEPDYVTVEWVKGHADHPLNCAADRLATNARRSLPLSLNPAIAENIVTDMLDSLGKSFKSLRPSRSVNTHQVAETA